jgi:hypothetical protein
MLTKIYIEGKLLDLFKDEVIELNSSIANTDDITKINSDYTKTFTVPASDNNNFIFKHYYDADIDNTFDARTKKTASIYLDGLLFRKGKIRLEKVAVKKNKPSSYTINFWGDLINFKDIIGSDELSSLPLGIYEHPHTSDNVKLGLTDSLFSGKVIYPLIVKKQLFYNSGGQDTNTNKLANIAYDGGSNTGIYWDQLNPAISLIAIIELIETKYNITFTRDFFDREEFKKVFLWVNDNKNLSFVNTKETQIDFTNKGNIEDLPAPPINDIFNLTNNFYICNTSFLTKVFVTIVPSSGYENVPYQVVRKINDASSDSDSIDFGTGSRTLQYTNTGQTDSNKFYIRNRSEFKFTMTFKVVNVRPLIGTLTKTATQAEQTTTGSDAKLTSMPKIKTIDFIKGIAQMFKLVILPLESGEIYVNTLKDYYKEGNVYDITKYISFNSYDVERGIIKNNINFKYQEPTTILNKQFKSNTGIAYGDELLSLADDNGVPLDGDTLDVNLPFEVILHERLIDLFNSQDTNIQYGSCIDDKLEAVSPKPILFYNNVSQLGSNKIAFINSASGREIINANINVPSLELGLDNPVFSLSYGVEYSTWSKQSISGTLFYNYWKDYITSIFNIKKRSFKFKGILPIALLTRLKLNDVLFIKDRYYRINDFTVGLLDGDSTLNLTNTFETNFGLFLPSSSQVYLNYKAQEYSIYVSNGSIMNIVLQDIGFGTSWATVTQTGSNIVIDVTENTLIENRDLFINVDNGNGKSFQIYLNQDNKIVTFDTTIQTFDSGILTFDAE